MLEFWWLFTYIRGASLHLKGDGSCLRYKTCVSRHTYVASVRESTFIASLQIKAMFDASLQRRWQREDVP